MKGNKEMKKYIGTKLIEAESMTFGQCNELKGSDNKIGLCPYEEGYMVKYSDGHTSWSPKSVFERAYLPVDDNKDLPSGVSIGPQMVDEFIAYTDTQTMGNRTTVVRCVLRNGFEIVESSSSVDPKNYSEDMGYEICMNKIKDKIWALLGFLLQTAWHGIR